QSLSQSFSAEYGSGSTGKVEFSENFRQFVNNASSLSKVSVGVFTIGSKGVERLQSSLLLANDDLTKIQQALSTYLTNLGNCGITDTNSPDFKKCDPRLQAAAVEFHTAPFSSLGGPRTNAKLVRDPRLDEILNAYYDYSDRYARYG